MDTFQKWERGLYKYRIFTLYQLNMDDVSLVLSVHGEVIILDTKNNNFQAKPSSWSSDSHDI